MKTVAELIDRLTTPEAGLIEDMKKIDGDIMILGAGGKIGSTLSIKAKRAMDAAKMNHRVIAVSLFDYKDSPALMKNAGVEVIEANLLDEEQLGNLPKIKNIIFMVGKKFGTSNNSAQTWAINVLLPGMIAKNFSRSSLVVFSTGNVYGMSDIHSGGASEKQPLEPVGEYAQTCLGRERVMEYYSRMNHTPTAFFRLNYAIDMRYGVLHDIAECVLQGKAVDLSTGYFNCIWQGDVAGYAIRSLLHCSTPPERINITGPESISVQWAAKEFGERFRKSVSFVGEIPQSSLFSNSAKAMGFFGYPSVTLEQMIDWTSEWCLNNGEVISAPTHFEERNGKY